MLTSFRKPRRHTLRHFVMGVAGSLLVLSSFASAQDSSRNNDPYSTSMSPYGSPLDSNMRDTASDAADSQSSIGSGRNANGYRAVEIQNSGRGRTQSDSLTGSSVRRNTSDEDVLDEKRGRTIAASKPVPPSEFEAYVSDIVDKPLRRFGADLLVPRARDFTTPPTSTVPDAYRLNPGDEVIVGITGSVEAQDLSLEINSDGQIFLPKAGAVTLAGVRYGDAKSVITRQLSQYYRDFRVSVTVGRLHGITVYVTGFANTPGSYTLSSLSTLVNAVLAAGGPSAGGSFRSIQLRRQGRLVSNFDLYDLLLRGDKTGDAMMQNGDVIYIAPAGPQVAVIGSVNNEAIFEANPGDSLADVLSYAGGVNTVADSSRVMVYNPVLVDTAGWEELTPDGIATRIAKRGEIVRVLSSLGIARPMAQQPMLVTISGEVPKPGRYYLQPGANMAQLLEQAGGVTQQAYPFATVITRESVKRQQRESFEKALADVEFLLTTQPFVSASRASQVQPATLDAIQKIVQQMRDRKPEGRLVLGISADARTLPGDMVLENNDSIYIPPQPVSVGVFGAVPSPGSFQYNPSLSLAQVLARAGGVRKLGDRSQLFIIRANGSILSKKDLGKPSLPGDLIYVPIATNRGEIWERIRDISSIVFQGALAAATTIAVTK